MGKSQRLGNGPPPRVPEPVGLFLWGNRTWLLRTVGVRPPGSSPAHHAPPQGRTGGSQRKRRGKAGGQRARKTEKERGKGGGEGEGNKLTSNQAQSRARDHRTDCVIVAVSSTRPGRCDTSQDVSPGVNISSLHTCFAFDVAMWLQQDSRRRLRGGPG